MYKLTRTDVTAVKLHEDYILTGIGSDVNIFNKSSGTLKQSLQGLHGQKIYSFVVSVCGQKIIIFGGKQFSIISKINCKEINEENKLSRLFNPILCDDWINSGIWIENDLIALLSAHNVVQTWNIITKTMISQHCSSDNSILYCGLLVSLQQDILVLAGTVFSEVIIHRSGDNAPLHHLTGHKGVIFSISCDTDRGIIVTTSDDRSVRIWGAKEVSHGKCNTIDYWKSVKFTCKHELYGHSARVMRSCISADDIISVGEDSAVCYWGLNGCLIRKIVTHQNSSIWSIDVDKDSVVTGGGDCAVVLHPLSINNYCHEEILRLNIGTPKKVLFTAKKNIVLMNDTDDLVYYNVMEKYVENYKLEHTSTYKHLSLSSCKQLIAVGDSNGKLDVFVESCKGDGRLVNIIDTNLHIGRVLSLHWLGNRHIVLCSENGVIKIVASKDNDTEIIADFILPLCKERWLTAGAVNNCNNLFALGDRCGNIHVYLKGNKLPVQTFKKVHGRYGPTTITFRGSELVTTGRDGTIKYFTINDKSKVFKLMRHEELEFQWVEKCLDNDGLLYCGFQERVFVVYNIKNNCKILEIDCGGGHRSWDIIRYYESIENNFEESVMMVYLKNSEIHCHSYRLSKIIPKNIINGSHSKNINCLKMFHWTEESKMFCVSGGEDTTLRISSIDKDLKFQDEIVLKHLSNVRTIKFITVNENEELVISAGGRAQLCLWKMYLKKDNNEFTVQTENIIDYLMKGTDKERKGNKTWLNCDIDFDPETRIMDVDLIRSRNEVIIFAGCSDAYLRVFKLAGNSLEPVKTIKYNNTCILKTHCFKLDDTNFLLTATTRGEVIIWTIDNKIEPVCTINTNKSGINSLTTKIEGNNSVLIGTGGDDNAIHLTLLRLDHDELVSVKVMDKWHTDKYHSSQITGLWFVNDLLLSTGIDQRITLFRWKVEDCVKCWYLWQGYTDIADVQGMEIVESTCDSIKICVFGKGMELLEVPTARTN